MVFGMACYITFADVDAETRFKKWLLKGNAKSESMGYSSVGLTAKTILVAPSKYLFLWEHIFLLSFPRLLRFLLWLQFRKLRGRVSFSRVNKLELVDLVLTRGFKE